MADKPSQPFYPKQRLSDALDRSLADPHGYTFSSRGKVRTGSDIDRFVSGVAESGSYRAKQRRLERAIERTVPSRKQTRTTRKP